MFGNGHLGRLDWSWLYQQANDHRTATTKVFVWLLYRLDGWNLRTHLILSFLIYVVCVVLLMWFARKMAPKLPPWVILSFGIFFMSPIIWIDFEIGYAVAVHLWLLFMLVAAYCMFREPQSWPILVLGSVASILSIYSFAAGVATAIVLLGGFSLFKGLRAFSEKDRTVRRRELLQLLVVAVLIGGALVVWIAGWQRTPARLPWVLPYQRRFWTFFLNLVGFGFGIERISSRWGLFCLLIVIVPVCWLIAKKRTELRAGEWASVVLVLGLLADLTLITLGRTEYGIWTAKFPHYAEHGMPLIILSVINWSFVLASRPRIRALFIAALWLFCLMSFRSNTDFTIYQKMYADKMEGKRCVRVYYETGRFYDGAGREESGVDARCPSVFPWPASMAGILEQAKRLNPSFYQELTKQK
jgi:hypothetical protein